MSVQRVRASEPRFYVQGIGFGWCVADRKTGKRLGFFPVRERAREYSRWKNAARPAAGGGTAE